MKVLKAQMNAALRAYNKARNKLDTLERKEYRQTASNFVGKCFKGISRGYSTCAKYPNLYLN